MISLVNISTFHHFSSFNSTAEFLKRNMFKRALNMEISSAITVTDKVSAPQIKLADVIYPPKLRSKMY